MNTYTNAFLSVEGKTMIVVVDERAAFDALPAPLVHEDEHVDVRQMNGTDQVVILFQYWKDKNHVIRTR